jgi:hypothetical protein
MEDDLLALLAGEDGGVAAALLADRDARAALALLDRYRRSAEADARREVSAVLRLERARAQGLVPGRAEAGRAEAELDAGLAEFGAEPNEPSTEEADGSQAVRPPAACANDDAPPPAGRTTSPGDAALRPLLELRLEQRQVERPCRHDDDQEREA